VAFQYLKAAYRKPREGIFTRTRSDRTRGNGFKLKEGRFKPDIRKKFCAMRGSGSGTGCLEKWSIPFSWKSSRPVWMGL